ncbi:MAG: hypothetical protein QW292_14875 [Candidatus Parvarchaeota archaeon]
MTYTGDLQRALDLLFYSDRSREYISSQDADVLSIFSGDTKAARNALATFVDRHRESAWITKDSEDMLQVKVSGLFPDPEQNILRSKYVQRRRMK